MASMAFVGCSEVELEYDIQPNVSTGSSKLVANTPSLQTKIAFTDNDTDGISLAWADGDSFSVYKVNGDWVANFSLVDAASSEFESNTPLSDDEDYIAVYPARPNSEATYDDYAAVDFTTSQSQCGTTIDLNAACYMSDTFTLGESVNFTHNKSVFTVNFSTGDGSVPTKLTFTDSGANKSYEVTFSDMSVADSYTAHLMIDPVEVSQERELEFVIEYGEASTQTYSVSTSKSYVAGYRYTANVMELASDSTISITSMPKSASAGYDITIEGAKLDLIESIYIGSTVVATYTDRSSSSITFTVPELAAGEYSLTFNLSTGENVTSADTLVIISRVDIWSGSITISGWGNTQEFAQSPSPFADMPYGATLVFEFTPTGEGDAQLKLCDPDGWSVLAGPTVNDWGVITDVTNDSTSYSFAFADDEIDILKARGIIIAGQNFELTAIYYTLAPFAITSMPSSANVGEEITIEGYQLATIESIYIDTVEVTTYSARSDSSITFTIPEMEVGEYNLTFKLSSGEEKISSSKLTVDAALSRVDVLSGSITIESWDNMTDLSWSATPFADMPYGATLVFEFTPTGGGNTQLKLCDPDGWSVLAGPTVNDWGVITDVTNDSTSYSFAFADAEIDVFKARGIVISGQYITITAIYYTY